VTVFQNDRLMSAAVCPELAAGSRKRAIRRRQRLSRDGHDLRERSSRALRLSSDDVCRNMRNQPAAKRHVCQSRSPLIATTMAEQDDDEQRRQRSFIRYSRPAPRPTVVVVNTSVTTTSPTVV
jgi:hypothetical protein